MPMEKRDFMMQTYPVLEIHEREFIDKEVSVCNECPVTLMVNGKQIVQIILSSSELREFAIGHLLCEGILRPTDIREVIIDGSVIRVETRILDNPSEMCGMELRSSGNLGYLLDERSFTKPLEDGLCISIPALFKGSASIRELALIWQLTGGTHCTVILDAWGNVLTSAEDMGRHTSVDKAVGKAVLSGVDLSKTFMVCTGRLPSGMVAKAYRAGISIVVSNTAPFAQGIELALKMNMTVVGFARPPRATIYCGRQRIQL
jgi:FdhD protein